MKAPGFRSAARSAPYAKMPARAIETSLFYEKSCSLRVDSGSDGGPAVLAFFYENLRPVPAPCCCSRASATSERPILSRRTGSGGQSDRRKLGLALCAPHVAAASSVRERRSRRHCLDDFSWRRRPTPGNMDVRAVGEKALRRAPWSTWRPEQLFTPCWASRDRRSSSLCVTSFSFKPVAGGPIGFWLGWNPALSGAVCFYGTLADTPLSPGALPAAQAGSELTPHGNGVNEPRSP